MTVHADDVTTCTGAADAEAPPVESPPGAAVGAGAAGKQIVRDDAAAAEAQKWLAENEDDQAMTPERLAALEAAQADEESATPIDEALSPQDGRRFSRT